CGYALKVTRLDDERDLRTAQRDPYFMRRLRSARLDGQPIVPRVLDAWFCPESRCQSTPKEVCYPSAKGAVGRNDLGVFMLLMERFDNNMFEIGVDRAAQMHLPGAHREGEVALYERDELLR